MEAEKFRFIALQRRPSVSTLKYDFGIVTSLDPGHSEHKRRR